LSPLGPRPLFERFPSQVWSPLFFLPVRITVFSSFSPSPCEPKAFFPQCCWQTGPFSIFSFSTALFFFAPASRCFHSLGRLGAVRGPFLPDHQGFFLHLLPPLGALALVIIVRLPSAIAVLLRLPEEPSPTLVHFSRDSPLPPFYVP